MSSIIRIKRSSVSGNPSTLAAGELAYSALADNGSNGGDRLYIGMGTETAGNAANRIVLGGKFFTDMLDHAKGALTANSALVTDADSKLDNLKVDNLDLNGNTLSTTNTNGDLLITPNGTGKTVITNPFINDTSTSLAEFIFDTVGGAVTGGTGITITNSDVNNTSVVSITNTTVTAGSYGSATAIPVFTVNAQGQLTAASTASITTSLNIAGDTGSDVIALATDTITFVGGTGITSSVNSAANSVTFDIDNTVATLTGTQTLTNKTLTAPIISTISNTGTLTLPTSTDTLVGRATTDTLTNKTLTSPILTTPTLGAALATSITATSGNLTLAAASGNNSIALTPTGTGTVDVANKRITSVAEPTQATDAATKNYVDAVKTGLKVKDAVRVATTANLTATYANGSSGVGATLTNSGTQAALTIDSIALSVGQRVLVKNQSTAFQNGIYTVTTVGTVSTNWVLTRAIDNDDNSTVIEVEGGDFCFVQEGTVNADNGFVVTTNGTITIGTTGIDYVQFSGAGQVTAGDGLTKTGNTLNAVGTADRIAISADAIDIASTYVGQSSITTLGTIGTGTWNATTIAANRGGTGVSNAVGSTITLGGALSFSGSFTTAFTVTGNTTVTLPTTGTVATLAGTETFTNKTLTSPTINAGALSGTFSGNHTKSGIVTFSNNTASSSTTTGAVVVTGGVGIGGAVFVASNLTGAGAATSTLAGFNIDGGTY